MTTHPSEYQWRAVAEVTPTDPTTTLYSQGDKVYRIVTLDGTMKAPGFPTMIHGGTLIVRPAATTVNPGAFVRVASLSDDARRHGT